MNSDKPDPITTPAAPAVIPLPLALYESNGVIFELYRGGRSYQAAAIRWERLKTFTVSREDITFNVRVSQGHLETFQQ